MNGYQLLARLLKRARVKKVYGLVGIPITGLAIELQKLGISFVAFRNEQAASYAASVDAFMTRDEPPGVLVTVSGPGFIHGLPGVFNAYTNKWPMLVIVATPNDSPDHRGACHLFQELDHSSLVKPFGISFEKFSTSAVNTVELATSMLSCQFNRHTSGPCAPRVLEVSKAWLEMDFKEDDFIFERPPSDEEKTCYFETKDLQLSSDMLELAEGPLIVFGMNAAYNHVEEICHRFVEFVNVPFITMPMAKGFLSDDHPLCVNAARNLALDQCDLIILVGAPINWMLPIDELMDKNPRRQIILIDVDFEEVLLKKYSGVCRLRGSIGATLERLIEQLSGGKFKQDFKSKIRLRWLSILEEQVEKNKRKLQSLIDQYSGGPLSYYAVFNVIKDFLHPQTVLVTEGSNTMDIARKMLPSYLPRRRLDAGCFAAMGVGMPYAIAAAIKYHHDPVLYIAGDSAFGFSMAEVETAVRYGINNLTIIIMNNSGIYSGIEKETYDSICLSKDESSVLPLVPPTALSPGLRYDQLALMMPFGIQGFNVETLGELKTALSTDTHKKIKIINVVIATSFSGKGMHQ